MDFKEVVIKVNVDNYYGEYATVRSALLDYFAMSNESCNEVKVELVSIIDEGTEVEKED